MVIGLAIAVFAAGVAGVCLAPLLSRNRALHSAGLAFAAGTLLSMILLHVVPHAFQRAPDHAAVLIVVGFVSMMVLHQRALQADPCCGHEHARHAGLPSFLALCLCSLNDGVVLSSDVHRGLASPLLWAMCIHKAMASFALFMLLKEVGLWHRRGIGVVYMAGFLVVTPISLLLAAQLAETTEIWGVALAVAAGALLYVVAGSLVPRVEHLAREGLGPVFTTFLAAIAINVAAEVITPHDHNAHAEVHENQQDDGPQAPR